MEYLFLNLLFNSALASTQPGEIPILPPNVFSWAIGIGLLLALGSIIYAGITYIISAGNQSHQKESMDRIKGAVFGLILLISGWLILYTLNPEILRTGAIKIPEITIQKVATQEAPPPVVYGLCCQRDNPNQICQINFSNNTCGNCRPCPTATKHGYAFVCYGYARGARCIERPFDELKQELEPKE